MASKECNALAELAEQLNRVGIELCYDQLDNESKDAVRKAQRIIAELAKVETAADLVGLIGKCRAIAEEGVKEMIGLKEIGGVK